MTPRRHDIDALRALAFALLMLYHGCMLYVAGEDWGWHIKSTHLAEWLQAPMLFVNRWRMILVFLISGLSAHILLQRMPGARFAGSRTLRLLVPLVVGMIVIVPIQPYVQGVSNGAVAPGLLDFLLRYYSGQRWPEGAFDGWEHGYTWNHLWYLAYLWVYTLTLAAMLPLLRSASGHRLRAGLLRLRGARLLLVPALPFVIATLALQPHFEDTGDLVNDWYRHAIYFTAFLYGWWIGTDAGIWAELARLRRRSLAAALATFAIYFTLVDTVPDEPGPTMQAVIWTLRNVYIWFALCTILGWAHALLNRPWPWLGWANEAVFPWYVLHQSLTVLIAYWLVPLQWPAAIEASIVLIGTVAGCWAGFAVIRRVRWLRPLFGLKRIRPAALGANAAAAPALA
ncbi:acyltransferase family protein [Lysobacter humi (ex Lee et al. 2017)]